MACAYQLNASWQTSEARVQPDSGGTRTTIAQPPGKKATCGSHQFYRRNQFRSFPDTARRATRRSIAITPEAGHYANRGGAFVTDGLYQLHSGIAERCCAPWRQWLALRAGLRFPTLVPLVLQRLSLPWLVRVLGLSKSDTGFCKEGEGKASSPAGGHRIPR
jgi:hypothetical protein